MPKNSSQAANSAEHGLEIEHFPARLGIKSQ